jgi:hypothetical protein
LLAMDLITLYQWLSQQMNRKSMKPLFIHKMQIKEEFRPEKFHTLDIDNTLKTKYL